MLFYNDIFEVPLPPGHRFPMRKYRDVRLKLQGEFSHDLFAASPLATREELETTHCPGYIDRFLSGQQTEKEIRAVGFPWSLPGTKRALSSVGGTVAAMRTVCSSAGVLFAAHIAGGTHHAFFDYGEGFCVFSDIAVAANLALQENPKTIRKVVIIDLDVHQGNGNAKLFEHRPEVFTFSMHCGANLFSKREVSDMDIELDSDTGDAEYLALLERHIPFLMDAVKPDLIFFQAGVDIYQGDRLGKLAISREGIKRRNDIVLSAAKAVNKPLVLTMGGGYPRSDDPLSDNFTSVIDAHCDCYRQLIHWAS